MNKVDESQVEKMNILMEIVKYEKRN